MVWDPSIEILKAKLERVQNYAARLILDKLLWTSSEELRNTLNWQTLEERRYFRHAKLTYKILNKQSLSYLHNKFRFNRDMGRNGGRNADKIYIERMNTNWFKNSFHYKATKIWNSLDPTIRHASSLCTFVLLYSMFL